MTLDGDNSKRQESISKPLFLSAPEVEVLFLANTKFSLSIDGENIPGNSCLYNLYSKIILQDSFTTFLLLFFKSEISFFYFDIKFNFNILLKEKFSCLKNRFSTGLIQIPVRLVTFNYTQIQLGKA